MRARARKHKITKNPPARQRTTKDVMPLLLLLPASTAPWTFGLAASVVTAAAGGLSGGMFRS